MTVVVVNPEHQQQVDTAIQRLASKLKLELNLNKPEYAAMMESKEAFARIRQLLMAICELYQLKEQLWDEEARLSNVTADDVRALLTTRHQPINETIYQRMVEINYLTQYLGSDQLRDVDGYVEQIQPQLNRCTPRMKRPTQLHLLGGKDDDPEAWYQPQRAQLSALVERTAFDVISTTAEQWDVEKHTTRRTRTPKFA